MLSGVAASSAWAHAGIEMRTPAKGASVSAGVKQVRLRFDGPIITGKFVSVGDVAVTSSLNAGKDVLTGKLASPLGGGLYTVRWRIKASDGDTQTGSWRFRVR